VVHGVAGQVRAGQGARKNRDGGRRVVGRRGWRGGSVDGGTSDCLPFEWKFRGLRVAVEWSGTYQIDTGPTQYIKDLIPDSPGYMDYSALGALRATSRRCPYIIMDRLCPSKLIYYSK